MALEHRHVVAGRAGVQQRGLAGAGCEEVGGRADIAGLGGIEGGAGLVGELFVSRFGKGRGGLFQNGERLGARGDAGAGREHHHRRGLVRREAAGVNRIGQGTPAASSSPAISIAPVKSSPIMPSFCAMAYAAVSSRAMMICWICEVPS